MIYSIRGMLAATTALWLFPAGAAQAQEARADDQIGAEIVVTAQKRAERLLDVPAAISVVGGAKLEEFKSSQLTDIAAFVPGMQVDSLGSPGQASVSLRGIGPFGASATVSTYIDEAPVESSSLHAGGSVFASDLLPYDIERVEVLKGPQGTLYGASSIGGLLKYVMKAPDLDTFEVRAGGDVFAIADAGDVGYSVRAGLNVPIVTEKLAIRGSYAYQHTPGYIDNVVTGAKDVNRFSQQSARLSLLWQASDTFSLKLAGMWQAIDADNNAAVISVVPAAYSDPANPLSQAQVPPSVLIPIGDGRSQHYALPESFKKDLYFLTATADFDLGFANLIAASSYGRTKTSADSDVSAIYGVLFPLFGAPEGLAVADVALDLKKFTQELRLASSGAGAFEWMFGGFYTHEKSDNAQNLTAFDSNRMLIPSLDPFAGIKVPSTYKEYAMFGQVGYTFAEVFELTGGLRWARNDQKFRQISGGTLLGQSKDVVGVSKEDVWTWSISGRYEIGPRASLYARVATGYRPGGPNVAFPQVPPNVSADRMINYELGVKADVLGGSATIEAAVFLMDWNDIQLTDSVGNISFAVNGGTARAKGLELAASIRPVRGFTIGLNAAYTDARLTEDAPSVGGLNGARLPLVPEFSSSVVLDYQTAIGGDWTASAGAAFRFVSDRYSLVASAPDAMKSPDYAALDANIGVSNDRWTFRLFAKNLTDGRGILGSSMATTGFGERAYVTRFPIPPRTVGLAMDVKF